MNSLPTQIQAVEILFEVEFKPMDRCSFSKPIDHVWKKKKYHL